MAKIELSPALEAVHNAAQEARIAAFNVAECERQVFIDHGLWGCALEREVKNSYNNAYFKEYAKHGRKFLGYS